MQITASPFSWQPIHGLSLSLLMSFGIACGGSATFEGKVDGTTFTVRDALFAFGGENNLANEQIGQQLTIVLTNFDDACKAYKDRSLPKSYSTFRMVLARTSPSTDANLPIPAPDKGTYEIYSNLAIASIPPGSDVRLATAHFAPTDDNCNPLYTANQINKVVASAGRIELKALKTGNDGQLEASFQMDIGPQKDNVKGTVNAVFCPNIPTNLATSEMGETTKAFACKS